MDDAAIVDAPIDDAAVVDQPADDAAVVDDAAPVDQQVADDQPETDSDGRTLPKDVQAALKALRETNPKVAKALRESYFSHQQFLSNFKNPNEAKAAKLALDTVGGAEGIASLREQVQAAELLDKAAESGDPSIVDDWSKDFPEGFKKVMPYAIRQYQQMDAQGFARAIKPQVYAALESVQLADRLSEAFDAVEGGNKQQAQTLLKNIYAWLAKQKDEAAQISAEGSKTQPDQLSEREKAINDKEQKLFQGEIGRETFRHQNDSVEKALAPYLKGKQIAPAAKARLLKTINADINETLRKDQNYQRQVKAFLAKKDSNGTISFIKGHLDTVVSGIVQSAWKDLYGTAQVTKPVQQQTQKITDNKPQTPGAPLRIGKKPALGEIVKDNGYMEAYIAGKAIMATGPYKGKLVTWR